MRKDKAWLKEELSEFPDTIDYGGDNGWIIGISKKKLFNLIDQLDEPEQTDTNVGLSKPVIPQFVADYIELNKGWSEDRQEYIEDDSSGLWFALDGNSYGMPNSVSDWLFNEEKVETFARAWLDGYEVEKEPQWVVRYEDGYFSEEIKFGCGIDGDWVDEVSRAYHFTDKTKAEAVALLIGGTVEEVRE